MDQNENNEEQDSWIIHNFVPLNSFHRYSKKRDK